MLHFIQAPKCDDATWFQNEIMKPLKMQSLSGFSSLHSLIDHFMLRRTKSQKINGKLLLQLPPFESHTLSVTLSEREQKLYNIILRKSQDELQTIEIQKQNSIYAQYMAILELLLRLRQWVDHPYIYIQSKSEEFATNKANKVSRCVVLHLVFHVWDFNALEAVFQQDPTNFELDFFPACPFGRISQGPGDECPICLEPMGTDLLSTPCSHIFCQALTRILILQ